MRKISKKTYIYRKILSVTVVMTLALALLTGCGGRTESAPDTPENTAAAESAPAAEALPSEEALYAAAEGYRASARQAAAAAEVYAALERGWRSAEDAAVPTGVVNAAELSGGVSCLENGYLYVLSGRSVHVLRVTGSGAEWERSVQVGFRWSETEEDGVWGGCEKAPAELFVSGDRLAVISDWIEYKTSEDGESRWLFEDRSRLCVDIYDLSGAEDIRLIASYGQDGYQRVAGLSGGRLCVVSDRTLRAADCREEDTESFLPAVYNGGERRTMDPERVALAEDCRNARCTVLTLYDLRAGARLDEAAFLGSGEMVCLTGESVLLLSGRSIETELAPYVEGQYTVTERLRQSGMDVFRYEISGGGFALTGSATVLGTPLSVSAVDVRDGELRLLAERSELRYAIYYDAAHGFENRAGEESGDAVWLTVLDGALSLAAQTELTAEEVSSGGFAEDLAWYETADGQLTLLRLTGGEAERLSGTEMEGALLWLLPWDDGELLALSRGEDSLALEMYAVSGTGELRRRAVCSLGSDFHTAAETPEAVYLDTEAGILALPAEDGCAFFVYRGDAFTHVSDVFTAGSGGDIRIYRAGERLLAADGYKVAILRGDDLTWIEDKFF